MNCHNYFITLFWYQMISVVSLSKAAQAASTISTTAGRAYMISTTAWRMRGRASGQNLKIQLIQEFRNHFWKAAATRSSKRDSPANKEAPPALPAPSSRAIEKTSPKQDNTKAGAREAAFKHFHMSAASRAMKRHDVVLTNNCFLNEQVESTKEHEGDAGVQTLPVEQLPSPIDVATSIKAREDMHHHFWSYYQDREHAQNRSNACLEIHNSKNHHGDRFRLPKTLDAYFEAGSRMQTLNQRPCPMALTETRRPFKIVDVNEDWTKLCGYTREEAVGSTLKLLQGPETDTGAAKGLIASLLQSNNREAEYETVLVNYNSDGVKFKNHVRVGHLTNETGDATTHFVGFFKKLSCHV